MSNTNAFEAVVHEKVFKDCQPLCLNKSEFGWNQSSGFGEAVA